MAETKEITVRNQQSLEDLALEHYGGVEGVMSLLLDNRDSLSAGFNSYLHAGMKLRVRPVAENAEMLAAVRKLGMHPVSDENTGAPKPQDSDFNADFNNDFYTD
jgi:hypothetical protein